MGILDGLFGKRKQERDQARGEDKFRDSVFRMLGANQEAKSSGGHPVCPKCGYRFPNTEQQIRETSDGEFIAAMCPKCGTMSRP